MLDIKIKGLYWAGHIIRMENERILKMIPKQKCHKLRSAGKPRKRWKGVVQKDALQMLGIPIWRRQAGERERKEWRRF